MSKCYFRLYNYTEKHGYNMCLVGLEMESTSTFNIVKIAILHTYRTLRKFCFDVHKVYSPSENKNFCLISNIQQYKKYINLRKSFSAFRLTKRKYVCLQALELIRI